MSLVGLTRIRGASVQTFKRAISESLDSIGYIWEKSLSRVVIKTNLCYYWDYTTGQTTDPRFVAAIVDLLREKTSVNDIAILESDASAMKCKYSYRFLGYEKLFKDYDVRLVNLSEEKSDLTRVTCDGQSYRFLVPRIISNADLRINVPKIKYTMKGIELTCALKNMYGCNPYPLKYKYHVELGNVIVALNKVMKFDLCIIDANIVSGIQPRRMGLVVSSRDPVAIDTVAAEIAGLSPGKIKYLNLAKKESVGKMNYVIRGESISYYKSLYPRKTVRKKLIDRAYPWIIRLKIGKQLGIG
jgi:uncharacterized protein (DUF362 family)